MKRALLLIMAICIGTVSLSAQSAVTESCNRRYSVYVDFRQAHISGVCIMSSEKAVTTASIINEFGVSALTYRYDAEKGRVKILSIMKAMNRPVIKGVLKRNLRKITPTLLEQPKSEPLTYEDASLNIRYRFTPIVEE